MKSPWVCAVLEFDQWLSAPASPWTLVLWDKGRMNDGNIGYSVHLLTERSRLKKEAPNRVRMGLTQCYRNEAPSKKWSREQSQQWISGEKAESHCAMEVLSARSSDLRYGEYEPGWPDRCSEGLLFLCCSLNPVTKQKCAPIFLQRELPQYFPCFQTMILFVSVKLNKVFSAN